MYGMLEEVCVCVCCVCMRLEDTRAVGGPGACERGSQHASQSARAVAPQHMQATPPPPPPPPPPLPACAKGHMEKQAQRLYVRCSNATDVP